MDIGRKQKHMILRRELWDILQYGRGITGHAFNVILMLLILISIAIIPLEFIPALEEFYSMVYLIEVVLTSLFTVEYFLRVYSAPRRLVYIFSFYGLMDLLSILPLYIGFFGVVNLQFLRGVRLVRIFKIAGVAAPAAEEEEHRMEDQVGLAPGEKMEYVVTHHPIFLLFGCLPPIIAIFAGIAVFTLIPVNAISLSISITLFLFALIFFWKAWLDYGYDVIYVTSQRLIFQNQHLLGRSVNQVNYPAITNVKPSYPTMFSYIFRYGDISIETPSEAEGQILLRTVKGHERAAHIIMHKCYDARHGEEPHAPSLQA